MYYTYVLQSEVDNQFCVGYTKNLKLRFEKHNNGYIDPNPLRAGLVDRPEEYRRNSLGYYLQTENKDQFLSTDFGLKEFNPPSADKDLKSKKRRELEGIADMFMKPGL